MGREVRLELDPELASAAHARRACIDALELWGRTDLAPDIGLAASELVTNAVLHAGTGVGVTLTLDDGVARLVVADGSPQVPVVRRDRSRGLTGRGLQVVDSVAAAWGVDPLPGGKEVWCEFGDRSRAAPAVVARPAPVGPGRGDLVEVHLRRVPLALLDEWNEQLQNLVRESILAARGAAEGAVAAPPVRLGALLEQIMQQFGEALAETAAQAGRAAAVGGAHVDLALHLGREAADAGRRYLQLFDEADQYARAGRLLTPESSPELRVLRDWYIGEIARQLADPDAAPLSFEDHLLRVVGEALEISVHAAREARLTRLSAALWGAVTAADVARVLVEEGRIAAGAVSAAVAVLGDDRRLAGAAEMGPAVPVDEAAAADVARTGEPVWVEALPVDDDSGLTSSCTIALPGTAGPAGLVTFGFDRPHLFPPDEREFILQVARRAADALGRAQLMDGERRLRDVLVSARDRGEFLAEVTEVLSSSLDVGETVYGLGRLLVPRMADGCAIWLSDEPGRPAAVAGDAVDIDHATVVAALRDLKSSVVSVAGGEMAVIPMRARNHAVGVVVLFRSERRWPLRPSLTALLDDTVSRAAIAVDNARLFEERSDLARTLQRSLLPPREPTIEGLDVAARFLPGAAGVDVGGDFYDVFATTGAGTYALVIGDVCGSGAEAASITSLARHTVRALAGAGGRPSRVLSMLNDALLAADIGDRFCTVLFGTARMRGGAVELQLSSGGHPGPVVVSRGQARLVDIDGTMLGSFEDPALCDTTVDLEPGDVLVLYTDGVTEARAGRGSQFGTERLCDVVTELAIATAAEIADGVVAAAATHAGGAVHDDVAVLVVRVPH